MATCCNPVTAPTCTPTPCPQLYNACCVINEANLPCLYPPVDASGVSTAYSYNITNVEVFGGDAIEDIVTGMTAFTVVDSVETAIGKVTVDSLLTTVTLDTAPATFSGNLVFKFVDQTQCTINKRIDEALCGLLPNIPPCPTFEDIVYKVSGQSLSWGTSPFGIHVQAAGLYPCNQVRLRGLATATVAVNENACGKIQTIIGQIVDPTVWPLQVKSIPTIAAASGYTLGPSECEHFYPAFYQISTLGVITLLFYVDVSYQTYPSTLTTSFDGVTYDVNAT